MNDKVTGVFDNLVREVLTGLHIAVPVSQI